MNHNVKIKIILKKIIITLFTVSISLCVLPSSNINIYGITNQIHPELICIMDEVNYYESNGRKSKERKGSIASLSDSKHLRKLLEWFELLILAISIRYNECSNELSQKITPIKLRVRMND